MTPQISPALPTSTEMGSPGKASGDRGAPGQLGSPAPAAGPLLVPVHSQLAGAGSPASFPARPQVTPGPLFYLHTLGQGRANPLPRQLLPIPLQAGWRVGGWVAHKYRGKSTSPPSLLLWAGKRRSKAKTPGALHTQRNLPSCPTTQASLDPQLGHGRRPPAGRGRLSRAAQVLCSPAAAAGAEERGVEEEGRWDGRAADELGASGALTSGGDPEGWRRAGTLQRAGKVGRAQESPAGAWTGGAAASRHPAAPARRRVLTWACAARQDRGGLARQARSW